MSFLKSKKLKKTIRTIHKYGGRIASVALPIAGAIVGGPAGAALGSTLGTAASYYGEKQGALASGKKGAAVKKAGRRGLKRGLIIGGVVTGGAAVGALIGGTGLTTGLLGASSSTLGGAAKKAGPQETGNAGGLAQEMSSTESSSVTGAAAKTGSDNLLNNILSTASKTLPSIRGEGQPQQGGNMGKLLLFGAAAWLLLSSRQSA